MKEYYQQLKNYLFTTKKGIELVLSGDHVTYEDKIKYSAQLKIIEDIINLCNIRGRF